MESSATNNEQSPSETPGTAILPPESATLLDTLRSHPGATLARARRLSRLGPRRVEQALEFLLANRLAYSFNHSGRIYLFPSLPDVENWWLQVVVLRRPALADLYHEMKKVDEWTSMHLQGHMNDRFKWVLSTAQRRLRRLESAGLVESYQTTRDLRSRYFRTLPIHPKAEEILRNDG